MDQPVSRFAYLFNRYVENSCSEAERRELMYRVQQEENTGELSLLIEQAIENSITDREINANRAGELYQNLLQAAKKQSPETARVKRLFTFRRIAVAASVLFVLGTGSYYLFFNKTGTATGTVQTTLAADVKAPVVNRAMITLANGQKIYLDSAGNGTLATEGNVQVQKLADGQISYTNGSGLPAPGSRLIYNTLTNPGGSKVVTLVLGDGTRVWLNSESSIKYPTAFTANERKVEITGEAYFEVAKDAARKFYVKAGSATTEVLGTHFNVNAYEDEDAIRVTLLEGSVKTSMANGQWSILKPGQQVVLSVVEGTPGSRLPAPISPDLEQVMAWKNGLFMFNKADIQTVMRQISRWYAVEVSYPEGIPTDEYWGAIKRDLSLSNVFKVLEESGAHFTIKGNKVEVLP